MGCGPKECREHAEKCLRRARTVDNPILAEEFEKLAQSWWRLADAQERGEVHRSREKVREHDAIQTTRD